MNTVVKTKKTLIKENKNKIDSIKMKFTNYERDLSIVEEKEKIILDLENRMLRLNSPNLADIKHNSNVTLIDLIDNRDKAINKLHSMSEYQLVKEVEEYLELMSTEERTILANKFFSHISYGKLSYKLNYSQTRMFNIVNEIVLNIVLSQEETIDT